MYEREIWEMVVSTPTHFILFIRVFNNIGPGFLLLFFLFFSPEIAFSLCGFFTTDNTRFPKKKKKNKRQIFFFRDHFSIKSFFSVASDAFILRQAKRPDETRTRPPPRQPDQTHAASLSFTSVPSSPLPKHTHTHTHIHENYGNSSKMPKTKTKFLHKNFPFFFLLPPDRRVTTSKSGAIHAPKHKILLPPSPFFSNTHPLFPEIKIERKKCYISSSCCTC